MPKLLHVLGISCRSLLSDLNKIYTYSWARRAAGKDEGKPGRTQLKTLLSRATKSTTTHGILARPVCICRHTHADTCTHSPKKNLSGIELEFIAETEPASPWAPEARGKGQRVFQGALTSAGFTGFLPPDDEQPTSFRDCLLPALANDQSRVLKRLCR